MTQILTVPDACEREFTPNDVGKRPPRQRLGRNLYVYHTNAEYLSGRRRDDFQLLFNHLTSREERYRLGRNPTDLTVGSLADDWHFPRPLLDPDSEVVAYQLTELAPLLRWLGESVGRELAAQGG